MPRAIVILSLAFALAACDRAGDGNSTQISIRSQGDGGNVLATADGAGHVAIKTPGFEGSIKLPSIDITAKDFDVDGARLYPGSRIADLDIDAKDGGAGKSHGRMTVRFESPAVPEVVRGWFRQEMTGHGFTVRAEGSGLAGTTHDGDPFALTIRPNGEDKTIGTLRVGE